MFEGIGRLGAYVAQQNLRLEAKYKLKTGRSLKEVQANIDRSLREALTPKAPKASISDSTKISIIRQKLRQGRKLSANELKFLKDTDERLYEKAKKAEDAREELQHALKHAKSKEEARRALVQAQMKVAAEAQLDAKGGGANVNFGGGSAGFTGVAAGPMGAANDAASFDGSSTEAGTQPSPAEATPAAAGNGEEKAAVGVTTHLQGEAVIKVSQENSAAPEEKATTENDSGKKGDEPASNKNINEYPDSATHNHSGELPGEKYLFMLAALQDEWKKFVNSKEYDELPERETRTEKEKAGSCKPKYRQEKTAADHIPSYRTAPHDFLPGDLLDLRSDREDK